MVSAVSIPANERGSFTVALLCPAAVRPRSVVLGIDPRRPVALLPVTEELVLTFGHGSLDLLPKLSPPLRWGESRVAARWINVHDAVRLRIGCFNSPEPAFLRSDLIVESSAAGLKQAHVQASQLPPSVFVSRACGLPRWHRLPGRDTRQNRTSHPFNCYNDAPVPIVFCDPVSNGPSTRNRRTVVGMEKSNVIAGHSSKNMNVK